MLLNWHSFITAEQFPRYTCKTGSAAKRQIASAFQPKPQSLHEIIQRSKSLMWKKKKERSLLKQLKVFLSQTESHDLFLLIITCKNHKIQWGLINIDIVSIVINIYNLNKCWRFLVCLLFWTTFFFYYCNFSQTLDVIKTPDIYNARRLKDEGKHEAKWKHQRGMYTHTDRGRNGRFGLENGHS